MPAIEGQETAHKTPVMCDWTTGVHRFIEPVKPLESGRIMKIDVHGAIEWEKRDWLQIVCPSSDTSLRISCDGDKLRFMGNIGRWQEQHNLEGISVIECVAKWAGVLQPMGIDTKLFGTLIRPGTVAEAGTTLTRLDLAGNYEVDDYKSWIQVAMLKRLGRRLPMMGKYGPTWGYDAKRGNWWKAKIYDKSAEMAGERGPRSGATVARFELQLGSEYLKQNGLNQVSAWKAQEGRPDMAQIIYGRFASELFREQTSVEDWQDIPPKLRMYAILWRDGVDVRPYFSHDSSYCRMKSKLREYGVDISAPCNVIALSRRVREVTVTPISALRVA